MFPELKKYKTQGHFFFMKGNSLKEASNDVPDLPGVFYVFRLAKGKIELVYIGKSGPIVDQGLRDRLSNNQEGAKLQEFFEKKFEKEKIDGLDIYWFVTIDKTHQDLPNYVEGLILQRYFETYKGLPVWNKEY